MISVFPRRGRRLPYIPLPIRRGRCPHRPNTEIIYFAVFRVGRGLAPAVYHLRRIVDIYGFLGRERRLRRSVGFDAFHGQPQGYDFVFSICSGRRPHRSKWFFTLFACGESVRRRRVTRPEKNRAVVFAFSLRRRCHGVTDEVSEVLL